MTKKIKRIAVLTSGGDSPGMNAAIRAVVRAAVYYHIVPFGVYEGYKGLINGQFQELNARSVANIINQGGTFLKSARSSEFCTKLGRQKAYEQCIHNKIDALIVIGGDGTFTGAQFFSKEFDLPVIGIPGTIDNDIYGTDCTIGYDTALNTVIEAVDKIRDTATSHNRLFFIEVMGRNAGFIALRAGIGAGAENILIPDSDRDIHHLLASLKRSDRAGKTSSIILVAEGKESGRSFQLAKQVNQKLSAYEIKVTILGHIQRGGRPSCQDRVLASQLGVSAIEALLNGKSNIFVGIKNNQLVCVPLSEVITHSNPINAELLHVADIVST
ncbi:MAG: 6-phosphofructokinase [Endozoicomonadaceae bacterium]|nr:6-phosphofructokinase [Endozoicomonadaceae bacterium]